MFLSLFKSYMEAKPIDENQSADYYENLAKDLANRRGTDFKPVDLVRAMPDYRRLNSVSTALKKVIVKSKRDSRVAQMHRALAKAENLNLKLEKAKLSRIKFEITENEYVFKNFCLRTRTVLYFLYL